MSVAKINSSFAVAAAAAAMFALSPMAVSAGDEIKCMGVNACKGHSACKTADSACKGKNSCKGHGFVLVSEQACADLGGDVG